MRIGLLTDMYLPSSIRELWPEIRTAFAGVDLILHGGDIVTPGVLDWLDEIAPTLAAQGNNDQGWTNPRMQACQVLDLEDWRLVMMYDMEPEDRPIADLLTMHFQSNYADILVPGHTHFERLDYRDGVSQINSGSPTYPHQWSTRLGTVGLMELTPTTIDANIIRLGETPERRKPGAELALTIHKEL